jgi:hypothetical protein
VSNDYVSEKAVEAFVEGGADAYLEEMKNSPPAERECRRSMEQANIDRWDDVKAVYGSKENMREIVHKTFHDYYNLKICIED